MKITFVNKKCLSVIRKEAIGDAIEKFSPSTMMRGTTYKSGNKSETSFMAMREVGKKRGKRKNKPTHTRYPFLYRRNQLI